MKKILAMLVAVCLMMSLAIPAFATEVETTAATTETTTATETSAAGKSIKRFLFVMIFLDLQVKRRANKPLIIIEPGAHIANPVSRSANIAPKTPIAIEYGIGSMLAAMKIIPSPQCTYPLYVGICKYAVIIKTNAENTPDKHSNLVRLFFII